MLSPHEDASSNLDREQSKSPKQSDLATFPPNPGQEHEKSPWQSDSSIDSPNHGEEDEKISKQSDSATVSLNLGMESKNSPKRSDCLTVSFNIGDGKTFKQSDSTIVSLNPKKEYEKSPKQSDYRCDSPYHIKGHTNSYNLSDLEDSFKLSEECQKTAESVKKKNKRSFENAACDSPSYDEEHHESEKSLDLEDSFKPCGDYQKSVESVNKKQKRSCEIADIARDDVGWGSTGSPSKQLVLYDPAASGAEQGALVAADEVENYTPSFRNFVGSYSSGRVLPSIGAFTIQCSTCFKWRLMPTKEKYEKIRETILQDPFTCERAREWRPDITCEDPTDISQDGSRVWAIDKPNIAQPPPGWERILRIRAEGGTKFADVYYAAPSGKRLRSMVEVQRYLLEHPEYVEQGVHLSKFSFQIPKPLQEDYVRKRPPTLRLTGSSDPGGLESSEANPLSWAPPPTSKELEADGADNSASYCQTAGPSKHNQASLPQPTRLNITKQLYNSTVYDQANVKLGVQRSRSNLSFEL